MTPLLDRFRDHILFLYLLGLFLGSLSMILWAIGDKELFDTGKSETALEVLTGFRCVLCGTEVRREDHSCGFCGSTLFEPCPDPSPVQTRMTKDQPMLQEDSTLDRH